MNTVYKQTARVQSLYEGIANTPSHRIDLLLAIASILVLVMVAMNHANAAEQFKSIAKPVLNKPYGQVLIRSSGKKLSMKSRARLRKLAARLKTKRQGACVVFTGSASKDKTLGARYLGLMLAEDLYRIDLSFVISKYIGETEKNLSNVFRQAEARRLILFFDEADTLFGKRTDINGAHDRYANLETAYLLQLLERHKGIVVLTTNLRGSLDKPFQRRCRYEIKFP